MALDCTPAALYKAASCLSCSLSHKELLAVIAYVLCQGGGGGGGSVQDMQVAWTPTGAKLGQSLGFFSFGDTPGITSVTFNQTTNLSGFDIESNATIASLSWPNLVSVDPSNTQGGYINLNGDTNLSSVSFPLLQTVAGQLVMDGGNKLTSLSLPSLVSSQSLSATSNPLLTTVSIPSYVPTNGQTVRFAGDALTSASVNAILHRCVLAAGFVTGTVDLSLGTNAAPTGQGIVDKATLSGRGVTVTTN